jgi:hypothetical protein
MEENNTVHPNLYQCSTCVVVLLDTLVRKRNMGNLEIPKTVQ